MVILISIPLIHKVNFSHSRALVTCPANGKYVPEFTINAAEIVELVEAADENTPPNVKIPQASPVQGVKHFEDPAIVSMGKRPTPVINNHRPSLPTQWNSISMERQDSARTATGREENVIRDITPAATLVQPMQKASIRGDTDDAADGLILEELEAEADISPERQIAKNKKPRPRTRKNRRTATEDINDPAATPAKETARSKGWRQTPLLEPNPSFQPFSTLKKNRRRNGKMEENGWATEDATDVQDMGEFNFEDNNRKFDKRTVFNEIQAEDSIADEDRLVAHNRLPKPKPGTAGGKNLHYTENVLDVPNGTAKVRNDAWKSDDESEMEERASQRGSGSGRLSRRAESKLSINRRPVSRKGSGSGFTQPVRTISVRLLSHDGMPITNYTRYQLQQRNLPSSLFLPTDAVRLSRLYKCLI
jgi:enhancer of mRNA-decapping protein 3